MQYHFISGLPRAGSTLLASILRQNPDFTASMMSPMGNVVTAAVTSLGSANEADHFITDDIRMRMIRGMFDAFYQDHGGGVVFDNNRRWCANLDLLATLFPDCRVLCCVRSPAAIVDSFERLFRKNPLALSVIYGGQTNMTVYERTMRLMQPEAVLGFALNAFKTAFYSDERKRLLAINYDDLCRFPGDILKELHKTLELPPFDYDFKKIAPIPGSKEFDRDVSTPGLHDLKPEVVYEPRQSILPPDIYNNLPKPFWQVNTPVTPVA